MQRRRSPGNPRAALLAGLVAACALVAACSTMAPAPGTPATSATDAPSSSPSGPSRPFRPTPIPAPSFSTHVVRRGDTLEGLARHFGTTVESLAYWNRARYPSLDPESPAYRPDRIDAGWELVYIPDTVVDPEDLPTASVPPSGEPTPGVVLGPFPTLPADGGAALVERGPSGLDGVALTFEYAGGAGRGPGGAEAVVEWLEANGIPATVFVGAGAAAPDDAAAAAVLGRLAGARSVATGLRAGVTAAAGLGDSLRAADASLAGRLGGSTAPLLRPSDGRASPAALSAAGAAGWTWVVTWDVDPGDGVTPASGGPIADDIVARVVSRASGGSIVRLQLGGAKTLEALPEIVDGLAAGGLGILPLARVLGLEEQATAPGGSTADGCAGCDPLTRC